MADSIRNGMRLLNALRSIGVPLDIISKVLLRYQNLKTIQAYLGKVSDSEAIRWMHILHGK